MNHEERKALLYKADDLLGKKVRIKLKSGRVIQKRLVSLELPWENDEDTAYISVRHSIGPGFEPFDLFNEVESLEEVGEGTREERP